jgi:hypothetical protein
VDCDAIISSPSTPRGQEPIPDFGKFWQLNFRRGPPAFIYNKLMTASSVAYYIPYKKPIEYLWIVDPYLYFWA